MLWQANARDGELRLTSQTQGSGAGAFDTTFTYDANTGRIATIQAGPSNAIANFSYTFDALGNLTARSDANLSTTESFCYDLANRLVDYSMSATCTGTGNRHVVYDPIGNIVSKSDIGT